MRWNFCSGQPARDRLAPTFDVFLAARAIQAVGVGGIFPVATAAIADRIAPERRGAALGLVAATWGLAAIIGPLVGGAITHYFSWHWIFAANIPLALIVIVLALRYVPAFAPAVRGPLDVAGIALLAVGLLATMTGPLAARRSYRNGERARQRFRFCSQPAAFSHSSRSNAAQLNR